MNVLNNTLIHSLKIKAMKNAPSWILTILIPILAVFAPALVEIPDMVLEGLLTSGGYVGLIVVLTQMCKPLVERFWTAWWNYKYFGESLSLVVAVVLAYGAYFLNYGIFELATWYWTLGISMLGWFAANGWYDKIAGKNDK